MDLRFQIISVGWHCEEVLEQTLRSVEKQSYPHWRVHVVDDCSGGRQQRKIRDWCDSRDDRWMYTFHDENRGAVRNQFDGVRDMGPGDEDIIVFLDLDGDQLAHERVLERLVHYYSDDTLVTYGNYRPVPDEYPDIPSPVSPFPPDVVAENSYRQSTKFQGTRYNHPRTVKWKVLKEIPESYFKFDDGEWIYSPADLIVMMGALELAGGRYKCIKETLLLYNAEQPHPDNLRNQKRNVRGADYTFELPPLEPLYG